MQNNAWRADFPILTQTIRGKPLTYLDSAATTQKPQAVLDALTHYYTHLNANVHRGVYYLSEQATKAYEVARQTVAEFIHAPSVSEVIFTRGTTEAINLVATSLARLKYFQSGDEIILSGMEHHSNIVPWQLIAEETGIVLRVIPVLADGTLDLDAYTALFSAKTKCVSVVHVSNVLGTINPIEQIVAIAQAHHVPVLVDGAQAVGHIPVDVQALGCDFYAFSAHKMYGPTGIGVLWGRSEWLHRLPPYQGGGDMIRSVSFEKTTFADIPAKFEAGTPAIAEVIGLKAAIDYTAAMPWNMRLAHEAAFTAAVIARLQTIPGVRMIGNAASRIGVISFV